MCQNEREPECLAVLLEWICRCADDTRRLWKTTEYCGRARECRKEVSQYIQTVKSIGLQSKEVWSMGEQISR